MLYMTGGMGEVSIIVLETENLENIKAGKPATTPDGRIVIAWTPDPEWLAQQIATANGNGREIGRLIDEAAKRPQAPIRPYHETRTTNLAEKKTP
jgi:hypothetical protein